MERHQRRTDQECRRIASCDGSWLSPFRRHRTGNIKSSLGLGIVRFEEQPEEPEISTYDYEYRTNTEVITAVEVSGGQSDPDDPVTVQFHIDGTTYTVSNVYYPDGDSQLAWVRWTTPDEPQDMTIDVDACIGPRGQRVSNIVDVLGGEKIDIVKYNDDPAQYVSAALAPSEVCGVEILDEDAKSCRATVPDDQLSLAIGNKGQNVRLAARLTGWKIDIKPESGFFTNEESKAEENEIEE